MQFDKETIVNLLRERGDTEQASRAQQELPDQVDTERDAGVFERFGIDPSELMTKVGGRDIPGL